jgi:hypothetical protein
MGYKTIETREDADDAELRNVTQMTDQRLRTSKEWMFVLKLDKTTKARWWKFASSFCIQPTKNNTSTTQFGKMCTRLDIGKTCPPTRRKGGEVGTPDHWPKALLSHLRIIAGRNQLLNMYICNYVLI